MSFVGYFPIEKKNSQCFYASLYFRFIGGNFPIREKESESFYAF